MSKYGSFKYGTEKYGEPIPPPPAPPEFEQKPVAPPYQQNPNFYKGAFDEALALFRIKGGIR